jgi:hypothetical protein
MMRTGPTTTLGDLHRASPWLWVYCEKYPHHAPYGGIALRLVAAARQRPCPILE